MEQYIDDFSKIMSEADKLFARPDIGASTRDYVRDVLFPLLGKEGFVLSKTQPPSAPAVEEGLTNLSGYSSPEIIGSYHWFHTIMGLVRDIGKFMETHDSIAPDLQKDWGRRLQNIYKDMANWFAKISEAASTTQGAVSEDAHEKEIMIKGFDKVQKIFKMREWVMEGRGSYPYNDDRYKEEVRNLYDEFEAIRKDTWENIESKSFEYRERIIANYLKEHPAKGAVWVKAVNLNEILIGKEYFYKFYNGKADEHRGIGNFNNINEFVPFDEYANVRREDFYYLEILDETGSQRQAGPGWVNCQDRMPEIDSSSDDPLKYILEFKIDGGRGMTDVDYVTAEEMRESVKLYDYCRWLDESQSTPSKEVDAVELLIWMIENGYIVTEEGEIWQKPNNALFTPEKLIELYQQNK